MRRGQKMTDAQKAKRNLRGAIFAWGGGAAPGSMGPWNAIEDAIKLLALKVRQEERTVSATVPAKEVRP